MSLVLNMVGGSGESGLPADEAVIHAIAPTGSTIHLYKDLILVVSIPPSMAHVNALNPDVSDYYYSVGQPLYGLWNVSATMGLESTSQTVNVQSNRVYDVELSYNLWLIKDGKFITSSGFTPQKYGYASAIFEENSNGYVDLSTVRGVTASYTTGYFAPKVTFTGEYKRLWIDYSARGYVNSTHTPAAGVINVLNGSGSPTSFIASTLLLTATTNTLSARSTTSVDISGVTSGEYYIGIQVAGSGSTGYTGEATVYNLYLTKE